MTQQDFSIRGAVASDLTALMAVARDTGLFTPDELAGVTQITEAHFAEPGMDHHWLAAETTQIIGAAYVSPEEMADGVWNLWFIGVKAAAKAKGVGSALLAEAEHRARAAGARLMLIETASGDDFQATRGFYNQRGYEHEATIRDYYGEGADKVIFRRAL